MRSGGGIESSVACVCECASHMGDMCASVCDGVHVYMYLCASEIARCATGLGRGGERFYDC